MYPTPTRCPVCGGELHVVRLHCHRCDTAIEGRFGLGALALLRPEQIAFVETFVRCEGKLNRMEAELGLSYPTLRSRLQEIVRAMGFEPASSEPAGPLPQERRRILEELDAGKIDAEEAMRRLQLIGGET